MYWFIIILLTILLSIIVHYHGRIKKLESEADWTEYILLFLEKRFNITKELRDDDRMPHSNRFLSATGKFITGATIREEVKRITSKAEIEEAEAKRWQKEYDDVMNR